VRSDELAKSEGDDGMSFRVSESGINVSSENGINMPPLCGNDSCGPCVELMLLAEALPIPANPVPHSGIG